jgi:3-isopropylmalate/(R)-2-methylmalate dehydratase large subunit
LTGACLTKKILALSAGKELVEAGDFIEAKISSVMVNDLTGVLAIDSFNNLLDGQVWDPERVVIVLDHLIPPDTVNSAELQRKLRKFAAEHKISHFYDVGWGGICHQILAEKGHIRPSEVVVGADSHTCTGGAFGAFATGVGSTDVAAVFATGTLWLKVPEVMELNVKGTFKEHVFPKDLILHIAGTLGQDGANYMGLEFTGPTIENMSVGGRMTLCNMAVEVGAKSGLITPDDKTINYVSKRTQKQFTPIYSDPDAMYERGKEFNVNELEPQVAIPHRVDNVKPVTEIGDIEIDQAFIGSCTNGRLEDLEIATKILRGKKVKKGVRLIVIPASQEIYREALNGGLIQTLTEAGAYFAPSTCGPCLGGHYGLLTEDEICISATNRNFQGRMGSSKSKVYLASPATVAASALKGKITNPKDVLAG